MCINEYTTVELYNALRPAPAHIMSWIEEFGLFVQIQVFQIRANLEEQG